MTTPRNPAQTGLDPAIFIAWILLQAILFAGVPADRLV